MSELRCEGGVKIAYRKPCPECGVGPGARCPKGIAREQEELKRMRDALIEIRDGYGPNHGSKFCLDKARAGLDMHPLGVDDASPQRYAAR